MSVYRRDSKDLYCLKQYKSYERFQCAFLMQYYRLNLKNTLKGNLKISDNNLMLKAAVSLYNISSIKLRSAEKGNCTPYLVATTPMQIRILQLLHLSLLITSLAAALLKRIEEDPANLFGIKFENN